MTAQQRTCKLSIYLILIIGFSCIVSANREKERCLESWFTDDLPLLTSNDGWSFTETRQNISTYWRESPTPAHIARIHKAVVYNIPATVEEVFTSYHTNRFKPENLVFFFLIFSVNIYHNIILYSFSI